MSDGRNWPYSAVLTGNVGARQARLPLCRPPFHGGVGAQAWVPAADPALAYGCNESARWRAVRKGAIPPLPITEPREIVVQGALRASRLIPSGPWTTSLVVRVPGRLSGGMAAPSADHQHGQRSALIAGSSAVLRSPAVDLGYHQLMHSLVNG